MTGERIELIVIFGGQSAEHDVSRVTAAHVLAAVDPDRYAITAVGIARDGRWHRVLGALDALAAGPDALPEGLEVAGPPIEPTAVIRHDARPTVAFPLLHGPLGEDGTIQGLLELVGVPYVGSGVLGSALAMDKAVAKEVLALRGFAQAAYRAVREDEVVPGLAERLVAELGLPLFVKPANMGSSVGVSKAKTPGDVAAAIGTALSYDEWVVVEEAIAGREIEVAVLGNRRPRASVPGEIVPGGEFYDYAGKYLDGTSRTVIPAPLSADQAEEVRHLAVDAFVALRAAGMARVDFFLEHGSGRFVINELNTIPGFTPISMYPKLWQASGISYPELIDELVTLALDRHAHRRRNTAR